MSTIWKTPEKAVLSFLARLSKTRDHALKVVSDPDSLASKFECIESTLKHVKESLVQIKDWDTMVVEQLGVLDQVLNDEIFSFKQPDDEIFSFKQPSPVGSKVEQIEANVGKLNSLVSMVAQSVIRSPGPDGTNSEKPPLNDNNCQRVPQLETADHVGEDKAASFLSECLHCLEGSLFKMCLVLLLVFPDNRPIKKRLLIYWWIGEGLVNRRSDATAEEVGEQIFQELLNHRIIKSITSSSFMVYPKIRRVLIQFAKKNSFLKFSSDPEETPLNCFRRAFLWQEEKDIDGEKVEDLVTVYNMNKKYLGSSLDLLSGQQKLEVLQMGRWQDSAAHHIEAEDYELLLERLSSQKQLKYVSLRGISRIETLPRSIQKLKGLLILDLRACHNLNKLPEEVAKLKSLTHLDVSECYLLDSMPKGLQHLSNLQVLKGFAVSNSNSNSCKISDLAQLPNLKKLSVRVGNEQKLGSLARFEALQILTIMWRVVTPDEGTVVSVSLPANLIKLDLRSVPFNSVQEWMEPGKLPNLKKLYIKGGNLSTLTHPKQYEKVESVRLNYLKDLQISEQELVSMFPNHQYLKRTNCHGPDLDLRRAGHAS